MHLMKQIYIVVICILSVIGKVDAQGYPNFVNSDSTYLNLINHFGEQDGLLSNNVYSITEDHQGRLWIANDRGVSMFNGLVFKNYGLEDGLPDYEILSSYEDRNNRLWFASFNGKVGFREENAFGHLKHSTVLHHLGAIRSFSEVGEDLYVVPIKGEAIVVRNDTATSFVNDNTYTDPFLVADYNYTEQLFSVNRNDSIRNHILVVTPNEKKLLEGNFQGVPIYDGKTTLNLFQKLQNGNVVIKKLNTASMSYSFAKEIEVLEGYVPLCHAFLGNDVLYGARNGLFLFDNETFELKAHVLKDFTVTSIVRIADGSFWISTLENGIYQLAVAHYKRRIVNEPVFRMVESGGRLFACGVGQIFDITDGANIEVIDFGVHERITDVEVIQGDVIASSGVGAFMFSNGEHTRFQFGGGLKDIEMVEDTLFVGAYNGIYKWSMTDRYDSSFLPQKINANRANTLGYFENELYFGNEKGLFKVDNLGNEHSITDYADRVNRIEVLEQELFYATSSDGVRTFPDTGQNYFGGRTVHQVRVFGNHVWMVLNEEIAFTDGSDLRIFSQQELNLSGRVTDVFETDHVLLIASSSGLYQIPIDDLFNHKTKILPKVFLNSFLVNGNETRLANETILDFDQNSLQFEFDVVYFKSTSNVSFKYDLVNESTGERFSNRSSSGSYSIYDLSPGFYQLIVTVSSGSRISEPLVYHFEVKRPFYQRVYFWIVIGSVLFGLIFFFVRRKSQALKKEHNRMRELYDYEQQALRAKMNPHFLFNVLNSIQKFFLTNDNLQGHKYLKRFAELVRLVLNNTDKTYVSVEEELDYLHRYIELEQLRSNSSFDFIVKVDNMDKVKNCLIPSMTIQPFIENSIWHAFKGKEEGVVSLEIAMVDNSLKICVKDNGCGFDLNDTKHKTASKGINIVLERLEVLKKYGHKGLALKIDAQKGKGTEVELIIPLKK